MRRLRSLVATAASPIAPAPVARRRVAAEAGLGALESLWKAQIAAFPRSIANGADMYVGQRVRASADGPEPGGLSMTIGAALAAQRHTMVIGGPGAGKSTMTLRLAARLSSETADATLLPLRVSARVLSDCLTTNFADALIRSVNAELDAGFDRAGLYALQRGSRWLVIIDGLDEIVDAYRRRRLVEVIERRMREANSVYRFLITTRPLPVDDLAPLMSDPGVGAYELEPFGRGQRQQFARRWFGHRSGLAERFLRQTEQPAIVALSAVPLPATLAAVVFGANPDGPLPHSRRELFELYVSQLFESRGLASRPGDPEMADWLGGRGRELAEHLAEQWLADRPLLPAAIAWIRDAGREPSSQPADWTETVTSAACASGLIVLAPDGLRFVHHGFAEHLAAGSRARALPAFGSDQVWSDLLAGARESVDGMAFRTLACIREGMEAILTALEADDLGKVTAGHLLAEGVPADDRHRMTFFAALRSWLRRAARGGDEDRIIVSALVAAGRLTPPAEMVDQVAEISADADAPHWLRFGCVEMLISLGGTRVTAAARSLARIAHDRRAGTAARLDAMQRLFDLGPFGAAVARDALAGFRADPKTLESDRLLAAAMLGDRIRGGDRDHSSTPGLDSDDERGPGSSDDHERGLGPSDDHERGLGPSDDHGPDVAGPGAEDEGLIRDRLRRELAADPTFGAGRRIREALTELCRLEVSDSQWITPLVRALVLSRRCSPNDVLDAISLTRERVPATTAAIVDGVDGLVADMSAEIRVDAARGVLTDDVHPLVVAAVERLLRRVVVDSSAMDVNRRDAARWLPEPREDLRVAVRRQVASGTKVLDAVHVLGDLGDGPESIAAALGEALTSGAIDAAKVVEAAIPAVVGLPADLRAALLLPLLAPGNPPEVRIAAGEAVAYRCDEDRRAGLETLCAVAADERMPLAPALDAARRAVRLAPALAELTVGAYWRAVRADPDSLAMCRELVAAHPGSAPAVADYLTGIAMDPERAFAVCAAAVLEAITLAPDATPPAGPPSGGQAGPPGDVQNVSHGGGQAGSPGDPRAASHGGAVAEMLAAVLGKTDAPLRDRLRLAQHLAARDDALREQVVEILAEALPTSGDADAVHLTAALHRLDERDPRWPAALRAIAEHPGVDPGVRYLAAGRLAGMPGESPVEMRTLQDAIVVGARDPQFLVAVARERASYGRADEAMRLLRRVAEDGCGLAAVRIKALTLMVMIDPWRPRGAGHTLLGLIGDETLDGDGREWVAEAARELGLVT